jgi:hypothetical protein
MFTSIDKALAALVMGAASIIDLAYGPFFGVNEETLAGVIAILTPIVVYLIPNRD